MSAPEPTRLELTEALEGAVGHLRDRDRELRDTTERVVVARLMIYLDQELDELPNPKKFRLDMEYERAGTNPKAFAGSGPGRKSRRKIVPDLIYHQRLAQGDFANHLAIEVKARPGRWEDHDLAKLALLTGRARYAFVERRTLRLPGPSDSPTPPPDRDVVCLRRGFQPYTFGALLRLYEDKGFIHWVR